MDAIARAVEWTQGAEDGRPTLGGHVVVELPTRRRKSVSCTLVGANTGDNRARIRYHLHAEIAQFVARGQEVILLRAVHPTTREERIPFVHEGTRTDIVTQIVDASAHQRTQSVCGAEWVRSALPEL